MEEKKFEEAKQIAKNVADYFRENSNLNVLKVKVDVLIKLLDCNDYEQFCSKLLSLSAETKISFDFIDDIFESEENFSNNKNYIFTFLNAILIEILN